MVERCALCSEDVGDPRCQRTIFDFRAQQLTLAYGTQPIKGTKAGGTGYILYCAACARSAITLGYQAKYNHKWRRARGISPA